MTKDEKLDLFLQKLQEKIIDDARKRYSDRVVDEWLNPENFGVMGNASCQGVFKGHCGDTMELYLAIEEGRVANASFVTDGCGPTIACGSMLTKMVKDKIVEDAGEIDDKDLIDALGGLPEENLHCATLAVTTLKAAIKKWMKNREIEAHASSPDQ